MMNRRREMLLKKSGGGGRLPAEYQEVEYVIIQNDALNGYLNGIRTGFMFSDIDTIFMDVEPPNNTAWVKNWMFVCAWTNGTKSQPYIGHTFGPYQPQLVGFTTTRVDETGSYPDVYGRRQWTCHYTTESSKEIFFGSWTDYVYSRTTMWYSFVMYKEDALVANFIPCYRKSDSTVGFYDVVNRIFHTNISTGTFEKGDDI